MRFRVIVLLILSGAASTPGWAQSGLLGPAFSTFVDSVLATPVEQRPALVDSFVARAKPAPLVESDTVAYFLYRGAASSVGVPGDMNGWDANVFRMSQLEGTDLWYYEAVFEPEARLDYKLVLGGAEWILDPLNPHTVTGGFGANSELAMPGYVQPAEIERYPDIGHGVIVDHRNFASTSLGDSRTVRVFLPAEYETSGDRRYGVMLFHDGLEYFSIGRARNVIDFLISEKRIDPIIGVFVPPNRRNEEYGFGLQDAYEEFIVEELMPFVDATYRTNTDPGTRGTIGPSLGGLISAQLCYRHPEQFGLCAVVSPSFQVNDRALLTEIDEGARKDVRFYVDWGTYEPTIETVAEAFVGVIEAKGYEYEANAWFEGHSWGNWRGHLSDALEYLFPAGLGTSVLDETIPQGTEAGVNFPNPFVDVTRIPFSLERQGTVRVTVYDMTGRLVSTRTDHYPAGRHVLSFRGDRLVTGNYVYHLHAGGKDVRGLMTVLR